MNAVPDPAKSRGIGTLGEKTLHAVLKQYFEPDTAKHEVKLGGYVADIINETGIIEVQTRQFDKLKGKLEFFLAQQDVTVVYPIAVTKWLIWVDPLTGEVTTRRRSPKRGTPCEVFYELYKIKSLLTHPRLRLCLVLLNLEEYRYLNGWSHNKKRGSSRCDRIPIEPVGEVILNSPADYALLLPEQLPAAFTTKDFAKVARLSPKASQAAVNVLCSVGTIARIGKKGRGYLYERAQANAAESITEV